MERENMGFVGGLLSKQKDTVSFRNTASYSIIDSANLEIKITAEILSVYNSLVEISTFCSFTFKAYITKNENFCPGLYFFQADNEYASPNGYDAVVWFHIFDDDMDNLYIKWIDFRKPGNDVFGFEYLFGLSDFFPNFQNEPSQNTEERIVHLSTNGLIDSLVPIWAENPRDWQHKIPKIKTSSGEILTTNDPTHDDVLLCNYNYDMFRDTAFKEITDIEELKRLGINLKVNPYCYKALPPTCRLFCKDLPFFF